MEFSGTQSIAAPIEKVWAFLVDVNNVAGCAPGFQSIEVLGDEHWKAVVDQRLQDDKLVQRGEHVVIMGGMPVASQAHTNFVKMHRVGDIR